MNDVIIIGGGASGLVSAIYAAKSGNKVTIIEKNSILGKKILITGNGKCNYWNKDQSLKHYNTPQKNILGEIINDYNQKEIMKLFESLGIIPKIKDGYYYPYSNQATSIQTALIKENEILGVKVITNCETKKIEKKNNIFYITTTLGIYTAKKIILSTGSYACPKTGSTGIGYDIVKKIGHTIIQPLPALVQLISNESYLKEWHGIRSDVDVTLIEDDKEIKKETGEIQLTNYGVSGICIFNISEKASKGLHNKKEIHVKINFLSPFKINNPKEFIDWMNKRNMNIPNRTISDLLDGILNYKLINLLLKISKIKKEEAWNKILDVKKYELAKNLTELTLNITGTKSFEYAQTTTGGIPLSEINPKTMESLKNKNFYITGELLDVDGECGGYNLSFAWITGMLAGKGTKND